MARSALMNVLQKLARNALAEYRDAGAATTSTRASRREFLQRAAALGAAGATGWSALALAQAPRERSKVVIVGAGLAGLCAARTLRSAGVIAHVIEGSPRVGGRCWTGYDAFEAGQIIEHGGELIDSSHEAIHALATELELTLDDLLAAEPKGSQSVAFFDGAPYTVMDVDRDFRAVAPRLASDARIIGDDLPTYRLHTTAQVALDRMPASRWIESRVPGGMRSRFGRLLANAYTEELGGDPDEVSAITVVTLLAGSPADRFSPYAQSDQRFHIRGGNDQIVTRIAGGLAAQIETRTRLIALALRADGRYQLDLLRDGAEQRVVADRVIVAIPFSLLRVVDLSQAHFRPRKMQAIRELGMGRNTKLQLQFAQRFWQRANSNGEARVAGAFQTTWDVTRAQPGTPGILNFFSGGNAAERAGQGYADQQARIALRDLEAAMPGATAAWNGRVTRNAWDRNPWSLGSYAMLRPGQYTSIAGAEAEPEGRVFFAGEHTSSTSQGYLNGAVETGQRAAVEVLASLGARRVLKAAGSSLHTRPITA
jgi:monoamine oxidase